MKLENSNPFKLYEKESFRSTIYLCSWEVSYSLPDMAYFRVTFLK